MEMAMLQNGCVSYSYDTEQQLAFANQHEGRGYCFCSTLALLAGANVHAGLTIMRMTQCLQAKLGVPCCRHNIPSACLASNSREDLSCSMFFIMQPHVQIMKLPHDP